MTNQISKTFFKTFFITVTTGLTLILGLGLDFDLDTGKITHSLAWAAKTKKTAAKAHASKTTKVKKTTPSKASKKGSRNKKTAQIQRQKSTRAPSSEVNSAGHSNEPNLTIIRVETRKEGHTTIKKKFAYRSHTQVDFSGETIQGKKRAPEVFYIFQKKRSEAHHVVQTPGDFSHHRELASDILKRAIVR